MQRARSLLAGLDQLAWDVVDRVDAPGKGAIAFRISGRRVGELATPLGAIPATGRRIDGLGIDICTIVDGKVTEIWVLADDLARLIQLDALSLTEPSRG